MPSENLGEIVKCTGEISHLSIWFTGFVILVLLTVFIYINWVKAKENAMLEIYKDYQLKGGIDK